MIVLGNRHQTRNWKEIWKGVFLFIFAASVFMFGINSIGGFKAITCYGQGFGVDKF